MTPGELRGMVMGAPIYKMSLGKSGRYEKEALKEGALVFQSDAAFYRAVIGKNEKEIYRTARAIVNDKYPKSGGPDSAIKIWRKTI